MVIEKLSEDELSLIRFLRLPKIQEVRLETMALGTIRQIRNMKAQTLSEVPTDSIIRQADNVYMYKHNFMCANI